MNGTILNPDVFRAYVQAGGWLLIPLFCVAFFIWHAYLTALVRLKQATRGVDAHDLDLEARLAETTDRKTVYAALAGLPGAVPRMVRHVLLRMGWDSATRALNAGAPRPASTHTLCSGSVRWS
jgi:hypothetical protein